MKTYAQKLLDPRWQRKRLEILQKADFTCNGCHATEETLHVHHVHYKKGAEPWDYDDEDLVALCHKCHLAAEEEKTEVLKMLTNEFTSSLLYEIRTHSLSMVFYGLTAAFNTLSDVKKTSAKIQEMEESMQFFQKILDQLKEDLRNED